jgi:hypothetical protein
LGAYSLAPKEEKILTIKAVTRTMVIGTGGKKEECTVCSFHENVKPMILNRVNCKTIAKVYQTPYIEEWAGKQIQIYTAEVAAFGEQVDALRIRAFIPKVELPFLNKIDSVYPNVIDHLKKGGSIADVEKKYQLSPELKKELSEIKVDKKETPETKPDAK